VVLQEVLQEVLQVADDTHTKYMVTERAKYLGTCKRRATEMHERSVRRMKSSSQQLQVVRAGVLGLGLLLLLTVAFHFQEQHATATREEEDRQRVAVASSNTNYVIYVIAIAVACLCALAFVKWATTKAMSASGLPGYLFPEDTTANKCT